MNTPREVRQTVTRYRFEVKAPGIGRDIADGLMIAQRRLVELKGQGAAQYDDAIQFSVEDDLLVYWFDVETAAS